MIRTGLLPRAIAVAAALPLASGVLVLAAAPASAAITSPGDGTPYTAYSTIRITASYPASGTSHSLALSAPGGSPVTVATAAANRLEGGTMSYELDTGCFTRVSSACRPAPNGTWTVTQSGGDSDSSTFVTRVAPQRPTSVSAAVLNPREVRVSWARGPEPDLRSWTVYDGGAVAQEGVNCSSSTCSTVISYATDGSGQHTYTIKAFRAVAPNNTGTLESAASDAVTATMDAAPQSPPPSESTDGGSTDGGSTSGGSTDGGSTDGGSGDGSTSGGTDGGSGDGSTSGGGSGDGGSDGGTSGGGSGTGDGSSSGGSAGSPSTGGSGAPIGTGTTSAGATADQQAVAQRKAFALGFSAFGPKLGIPKLPPLPQAQAPAIAPEIADGTFEETLGFEEQVFTEQVETTAASPTQRARSVVGSALDSERLLRSSAAALVLLLAGAHLRRWLVSTHEE